MYRTCSTLAFYNLGRHAMLVVAACCALLLAGPGRAQEEPTHVGSIAVLGPKDPTSAYAAAGGVLLKALAEIHVPAMTRGIPEPREAHPGIVFLLPQVLDGDRFDGLKRFHEGGGRVITFGVQDQAVSDWLGLSFEPLPDPLPKPLTIRVDEEVLPGAAGELRQYPDRVAAVRCDEGDVVAWYGEGTERVAGWVAEDRAAFGWIPSAGDPAGLERLLGALVVHFDERAARLSFQDLLSEFGAVGEFGGLGMVQAYVDRQGGETQKRLLDAALGLRQEALTAAENGSAAGMLAPSVRAEGLLRQAVYGLVPPSDAEVRAVFAALPAPGEAEAFVADLAAGGINAVFVYTGDARQAAYQSEVLASTGEIDVLAEVLAAAARQENPIDVFAWHGAFQVFGAGEDELSVLEDEGRLVVAGDGEVLPWLCPGHEANLAHEEAIIGELLERYPVRGVLLDFIRMPSRAYCYCDSCQTGFAEASIGETGEWPPISPTRVAEFEAYRQRLVTGALARLARAARAARPEVVMGATLFPARRDAVAQDLDAWVESGAPDMIVPLYYDDSPAELGPKLAEMLLRIEGRVLVVPARRPMPADDAPDDPFAVIRALEEVRKVRADGLAMYAYDRGRGAELMRALGEGAFSAAEVQPYDSQVSAALPEPPFPQAEVQGYPPAEPVEISLQASGGGSGELRVRSLSMDGSQETEVGSVALVDGQGSGQLTLAPGAWRLRLEGRLDLGGETVTVRRNGPALRIMSQREYEQARAAQERAETLDIAMLAPGRGTAQLVDEMRLMFDGKPRVEFIGSLTLDELRQWDILVISDPMDNNLFTEANVETLRGWTESGGRVLMLHNAVGHAGIPLIFLELADTFPEDRVKTKEIRVRDPGHPAARYLNLPPTIELTNEDHVLVRPNRLDIALLEPAEVTDPEKALAVASDYGRGRVVLLGLRLGQTSSGEDTRLNRDESLLLEGLLAWLAEGKVAVSPDPDDGVDTPDADPDQDNGGGADPDGGAE